MRLTKFDIGAEIISIITKGMYPDPKDALREYVQNGVDAHAKEMAIKIRQESIVVDDDGHGMNHDILRKAVRIGISDKSPSKNVGFMGIGIYSSFHLCNKLTIYSRGSNDIPNRLEMDFGSMKNILDAQREKRLNNEIRSEELVDLQTLLETCITLTEDGEMQSSEFPSQGTRVELSNIEPEFYTSLSDFEEIAEYLRSVIPLRFYDKEIFTYGPKIEEEITKICTEKNQKFEIINLVLHVNTQKDTLYRPYRNIDFNDVKPPFPPEFYPLQSNGEFFGVAWGCLNSVRKILTTEKLRGFILKKQGFSIGRRKNLEKYFPKGNTYFERYSGEVIIVNPKLLPNASRSDLEYSTLRTQFINVLKEVADKFDDLGEIFQETDKANVELSRLYDDLKGEIGSYNEYEENAETLVNKVVRIKKIEEKLKKRIKNKNVNDEIINKAKSLYDEAFSFEQVIQKRIRSLTDSKKSAEKAKSKIDIAKNVSNIKVEAKVITKNYESLFELLVDLEYLIDDEFKTAIDLIDELFIQRLSASKAEYYELLDLLRERIESN